MSSPLEQIVDSLQTAITHLNNASLAAHREKMTNLHAKIESAWAETDDALATARQIESEVAS